MKVGIRFNDNDYYHQLQAFFHLFILPTFKEVKNEPDHFVTHLTSPMIVELFNLHMPYIVRWHRFQFDNKWYKYNNIFEIELTSEWFLINEMNVYWDDKTDDFIESWMGNNDASFCWTDGKKVYTT